MTHTFIKTAIARCFAVMLVCLAGAFAAQAQSGKKVARTVPENAAPAQQLTESERFAREVQQMQQQAVTEPAAPGTYQILAKDANSHEVFPVDILLDIEKARDQKKVVYLKAGKSSLIKILPYETISAKNFTPLPEYGVQQPANTKK